MSEELKPCPFCGSTGDFELHTTARGDYIECLDGCGAFGPDHNNGHWNTRADLPPTPEQIAADPRVQKLVEALKTAADYVGDCANGYLVTVNKKGDVTTLTTVTDIATDDLASISAALAEFTTTTTTKETQ